MKKLFILLSFGMILLACDQSIEARLQKKQNSEDVIDDRQEIVQEKTSDKLNINNDVKLEDKVNNLEIEKAKNITLEENNISNSQVNVVSDNDFKEKVKNTLTNKAVLQSKTKNIIPVSLTNEKIIGKNNKKNTKRSKKNSQKAEVRLATKDISSKNKNDGTYENGQLISNFTPEELRLGTQRALTKDEIRYYKSVCRYAYMSEQDITYYRCEAKKIID